MTKNQYDCSKCPGFCCSYSRIAISDHDIKRLAKHFDLSPAVAREKFTYRYQADGVDERVLRHHKDEVYGSICRFFDREARRCTVYEARPHVCRTYPYGNKCGYYEFLTFEREHQGDDTHTPSC